MKCLSNLATPKRSDTFSSSYPKSYSLKSSHDPAGTARPGCGSVGFISWCLSSSSSPEDVECSRPRKLPRQTGRLFTICPFPDGLSRHALQMFPPLYATDRLRVLNLSGSGSFVSCALVACLISFHAGERSRRIYACRCSSRVTRGVLTKTAGLQAGLRMSGYEIPSIVSIAPICLAPLLFVKQRCRLTSSDMRIRKCSTRFDRGFILQPIHLRL